MKYSYDVIVVGAGYIGCSVAYHLAGAGLKAALVDQGGVGAGASRANYGNIQVQDSELRYTLPLTLEGFARCVQLETELGMPIGYRPVGSLLLIESESQWRTMETRLPTLHKAGVKAELVPKNRLPEIEPLLNPDPFLGACYHPYEAQVYPFALLWAYLKRGQDRGVTFHFDTRLTELKLSGGKVCGVVTTQGEISAPVVILTTGAWTRAIGQLLERDWAIPYVHGQAILTEPISARLNTSLSSAAFFEDVHADEGAGQPGAVLAAAQSMYGHLMLGEAACVANQTDSSSSMQGQTATASLALRCFSGLSGVRILRGWGAPVAFTADGLPFLGPVSGIDGLILATAFKTTVVVTPLIGDIVTQLVLNDQSAYDLAPFSPDRDIANGH
jgi:glycine/D-amino acid oxidase-like deaminating enzyme